MQQSRLDRFFIAKKSVTTERVDKESDGGTAAHAQAKKRSSTTDTLTQSKKLKRTSSATNDDDGDEKNFSLNQFYLNEFLLILSSLLTYHQHLFDDNELDLFKKFQALTGECRVPLCSFIAISFQSRRKSFSFVY